jgi:hypothetical protein
VVHNGELNKGDAESEPSPGEHLANAGLALGEAILEALPTWAARTAVAVVGSAYDDGFAAGEQIAADVAPALAALLAADVDEQRGTPLTLLRQAHGPLTEVLRSHGAALARRDEADSAANPTDVYAIAPRSFADLGEAVHEAGIRWGIAKAFAHRARHR